MKASRPASPPSPVAAPAHGPFRMDRRIAAGLFLLTLLLFTRSWTHPFVNYDDPDYVTANPQVRAGLSADGVRWAFGTADVSYWHPLTWLSHMADWQAFGESATGHHVVSTAWHALNAVLALAVLLRLGVAPWAAAFGAALFAWHPLRVESVSWVAERKDVLSGCFWLAAVAAYLEYGRRRATGGRAAGWYAAVALLFAGGLMSKPMVVTLPVVLLALDYWPLGRWRRETLPGALLEKLPLLALAGGVALLTISAQREVGTLSDALPLGARIANAVVAVPRYLGKFLFPIDLAVLYPHPGFWPPAKVVAAGSVVAALTGLAWWQRRPRPWLLVGWAWLLISLLPVSGVVQVGIQSMADRYSYLPLLGLLIALLPGWRGRPGPLAAGVAGLVLVILAVATWRQQGWWRDSHALFDRAIAVTRDNYLAHNNRGLAAWQAGRRDEAVADYRRSLEINPGYSDANNNLGHALAELGRPAEAVPLYRRALASKPAQSEIQVNLANALSDLGQLDEAERLYGEVLARRPADVNGLNGLGVVRAMRGDVAGATVRFEAALRADPANAAAHGNLGNVAAMARRWEEAQAHYRRALALKPDASTHFNLGNVLRELGRPGEAAASYRQAVGMAPGNTDAHVALGGLLAQLGRRDEAAEHLRTALRQRPDHPQARAWLDALAAPAK